MALSKEVKAKFGHILGRLDKMAGYIQEHHKKMGMDFETARGLVNGLDVIADDIEASTFGTNSMQKRQVELLGKQAQIIEKNSDEPYMETFKNPMQPVQTNGDEPYMSAYSDDQSSAVIHGKSTSNRPLTSH